MGELAMVEKTFQARVRSVRALANKAVNRSGEVEPF